MGDEHDGLAQDPLNAQEFILHLPTDQRVESRKWFIQEPYLRLDRERTRDPDTLLLAAGKLSRKSILAPLEFYKLDHSLRFLKPFFKRQTLEF